MAPPEAVPRPRLTVEDQVGTYPRPQLRREHWTSHDGIWCHRTSGIRQPVWLETANADALRDEVQLIKTLGFMTVRLHQKVEDPRFLTGPTVWVCSSGARTRVPMNVLRRVFEGLQSSPVLAGFCYPQATDTLQEANGLADAQRLPKLPAEVIRSIVRGDTVDTTAHRRPQSPVEQPNSVPSHHS